MDNLFNIDALDIAAETCLDAAEQIIDQDDRASREEFWALVKSAGYLARRHKMLELKKRELRECTI